MITANQQFSYNYYPIIPPGINLFAPIEFLNFYFVYMYFVIYHDFTCMIQIFTDKFVHAHFCVIYFIAKNDGINKLLIHVWTVF